MAKKRAKNDHWFTKMKKYLDDHPYMEPDGMQETQDIDEAVKRGDEYVYVSKKGKVLEDIKQESAESKQKSYLYIETWASLIFRARAQDFIKNQETLQKSAEKHARQARQVILQSITKIIRFASRSNRCLMQ